jgi:hypothetical protein
LIVGGEDVSRATAKEQRIMSNSKFFAVVIAGVVAGALATGAAQAGNVQWSVVVGLPLPVPLIVPGHVRLPVIVPTIVVPQIGRHAPVPVVHQVPAPHWGHGDRDRDGIPNRYDRVYNPRWDRDGDGVPNWRERHGRYDGHGRHDRHEHHDRQQRREGHFGQHR